MSDSAKLTLRFQNSRTHELLGLVADQMGVSKNHLAEQMLDRDIQELAEAEVYERDPLRSRMVEASQLRDDAGRPHDDGGRLQPDAPGPAAHVDLRT